jgi:arsenate reductase
MEAVYIYETRLRSWPIPPRQVLSTEPSPVPRYSSGMASPSSTCMSNRRCGQRKQRNGTNPTGPGKKNRVQYAMINEKLSILYLCTGNSCRSQMAEGWTRHLRGSEFEAYSAGIEVHGLNPRAVAVMAEAGVDISMHRSKHVNEFQGRRFDYVVTVCDSAKERCPFFPAPWPLFTTPFPIPRRSRGTRRPNRRRLDTTEGSRRDQGLRGGASRNSERRLIPWPSERIPNSIFIKHSEVLSCIEPVHGKARVPSRGT